MTSAMPVTARLPSQRSKSMRGRDETVTSLQASSLRSLWRAFRHGDASLVGRQVLQEDVQKRPPPRKSPHPVRLGHPSVFHVRGGACLATAIAVAVLTLLLASANAAPGEERPVAGASLEFNKEDGTLYIDWSGPIAAGMADDLRAALGK